jgi:low affinity Fe/Cu permease
MTGKNLPSNVRPELSLFDRFASAIGRFVARAPFSAASVALVILWLIEGVFLIIVNGPDAFLDQSYQIQINTLTTIITFLLVALLQNTAARENVATQDKLNAIAYALSQIVTDPDTENELRQAIGLEEIVGAEDQS